MIGGSLEQVAQVAVAGVVTLALRHRRSSWRERLQAVSWWLLPLDIMAVLLIFIAAEAAVI